MEIRLQNLTKVFPGSKNTPETTAVDNLDIVIPSGKLVGLLGPSGCGKSTTLYMISGLLEPTGGRIWFDDEDVTDLSPESRGIGLVFQNYALYPHMTIRKNIAFPLENLRVEEKKVDKDGNEVVVKRKLTKLEIEEMVYEAAKLVQIENLLERKPNQISGGQQQRVAIARALVKKPRVLLLDEPLSNLDARLRLQTREEIKRIQKETGITTVFVTHDQEEAMSISDEIVVMKLGVMQQRAAPQEVYNNPKNLFVAKFLGTPPVNLFEGAVKDNKLFINDECILEDVNVENQEVVVGIRPEGFVISENGVITLNVDHIETLGRDFSLVCSHSSSLSSSIKAIVDSDSKVNLGAMKLGIKKNKCFVFNKETEERVF